jgi:hypothetical protein
MAEQWIYNMPLRVNMSMASELMQIQLNKIVLYEKESSNAFNRCKNAKRQTYEAGK